MSNALKRRIFTGISCAAIAAGLSTAPASALLSDNVHGTGTGGMTNCNGSDFCVKKVGDELEVSYEVQFGNMLKSSDHGQTVKGSMIAFPSVLKDVQLDVIATGITGEEQYDSPSALEFESHPTHKFDKPVNVPIHSPEELKDKGKEFDSGELSFEVKGKDDTEKDESYKKVYPDKFYATHLKGDNIIKDYKKSGGKDKVVKGMKDGDNLSPDSQIYNASLEKAGNMPIDSPYDYLVFNNDQMGVHSFKITGKVKTESDLAYLPIRAKQGFYRCHGEGSGFGFTDNNEWDERYLNSKPQEDKKIHHDGCENLLEEHEWARSDDTLPEYSLDNDEVTKNNIKNDSEHGLFGSKKCAVTRDTGRYDRIEQDVEPRVLEKDDNQQLNGWGDYYAKDYTLHANVADTYISSGLYVAEDGCDQAGVKIALCDDNDKDNPDSTKPTHTKTKENDKDKDAKSSTPHTTTSQSPRVHQTDSGINTPHNPEKPAYSDGFIPQHKSNPVDYSPGISSSVEQGEVVEGAQVDTGGSIMINPLVSKITSIFN